MDNWQLKIDNYFMVFTLDSAIMKSSDPLIIKAIG